MTADERKELFRKYMADCARVNDSNKEKPNGDSIKQYATDLVNSKWDEYDIFSYDDEVKFEPVAKQILAKDSALQGVKWYSKFLAECKFKKLLGWFVNQIKINNGSAAGERLGGNGYDGGKVRQAYAPWRAYLGFELDCSLRCDYAKIMSGANYIHLADARLNIIPIFGKEQEKSNVEALQIILKHEKEIIARFIKTPVQKFELFDDGYPNEKVRIFFKVYSSLIKELKENQNKFYAKYDKEHKSMTPEERRQDEENVEEHELNLILYGPPGTGKTYHTVPLAMSIIKKEPLEKWKEAYEKDKQGVLAQFRAEIESPTGHIAFTTFHQSYGYEEFIEGIKPIPEEDDVRYDVVPGIFKKFCDEAKKLKHEVSTNYGFNSSPTVWKVSLEGTGDNPTRRDCLANNRIRIGWDGYGKNLDSGVEIKDGKNVLGAFLNKMRIGDIVLTCYSATTIDAVGVVTGEYEWLDESFSPYRRSRSVKWLVKGIREDITAINNDKTMTLSSVYRLNISVDEVVKIINKHGRAQSGAVEYDYDTPYVFIIDEINRGNVSKIFGELITLIEPTKRLGAEEEMKCKLPYSGDVFGVPKNVYIIGTMNTADRSLVQLDAALRRRFAFEEMMPDYKVIKEKVGVGGVVDGIDVARMLRTINERITALSDREHQIGHAYFMGVDSVSKLAYVFRQKIIPLLQEYFFDDYTLIEAVLCDDFIKKTEITVRGEQKTIYGIFGKDEFPKEASSYIKIYERNSASDLNEGTAAE